MAEKPSSRSVSWTALAINLGATPGLGSFVAGHRVVGMCQMGLAVSGFIAILAWFWELVRGAWDSVQAGDSVVWPPAQGLILGGALFAGAWLWSLVTSLQILRDLRKTTPPILPESSGR
ncbi:MAG: hypothetical protein NTX70_05400 [Verrucomicrobia bacterium]|nr:hypothetical protein [Verrucomicrobiota bacterium]